MERDTNGPIIRTTHRDFDVYFCAFDFTAKDP